VFLPKPQASLNADWLDEARAVSGPVFGERAGGGNTNFSTKGKRLCIAHGFFCPGSGRVANALRLLAPMMATSGLAFSRALLQPETDGAVGRVLVGAGFGFFLMDFFLCLLNCFFLGLLTLFSRWFVLGPCSPQAVKGKRKKQGRKMLGSGQNGRGLKSDRKMVRWIFMRPSV
jgi:hypothetical protein